MAGTNMNFKIRVLVTICTLISFANGSTKNTTEGCNATLICNQPDGIQWINASSSKEIQGSRFNKVVFDSFMILRINNVSRSDEGNYTCVTAERNTTIALEVCFDLHSSQSCLSTIQAGDNCTSEWITHWCKKSCGLCPEQECTETDLPTPSPTSSTKYSSPTVKSTVSATEQPTTDHGQDSTSTTATFDANVFLLGLYFAVKVLFTN